MRHVFAPVMKHFYFSVQYVYGTCTGFHSRNFLDKKENLSGMYESIWDLTSSFASGIESPGQLTQPERRAD